MMRLFGIDWSVAETSSEAESVGSQRVVEDEALFNECEFVA